MQDQSGGELLEFGFVENLAESRYGQGKIAILFHVEIHEFSLRESGPVEQAKAFLDGLESGLWRHEIDLAEDRGNLDRDVVDIGAIQ